MQKPVRPIFVVLLALAILFVLLTNPLRFKVEIPSLNFFQKSSDDSSEVQAPSKKKEVAVSDKQNLPPEGTQQAPQPYLLLPTGSQTYFVRGGEKDVTKFTEINVNPLNAVKGKRQTVTVKVSCPEDVTSIVLKLNTDHKSADTDMKLVSGDAKNGSWSASYSLDDTNETIYSIYFEALTSSNQKTLLEFPIR